MEKTLTLTAVFTPDEHGWTMAQFAEWPAVVTCGRTIEEARSMLARRVSAVLAPVGESFRLGPGAEWPSDLPLVAERIDDAAEAPAVLVADG